jgi:crossover junction endodeoxyribonuclease RuvC
MDGKTRILGIDPGLNITGYSVLDTDGNQFEIVEGGIIRSNRRDSLGDRLREIHDGLTEVIQRLKPDCAGLEELYSHYANPTTAIIMGHARGVICLACAENEIAVHPYAATQIKKIMTGNGRAPKVQVQQAVAHQLNLATIPEPADVADAAAIAICHHFLASRPSSIL